MNASNQIVQVPFRGDTIDAVQTETGEIFISPIRICDSLGLDWEPQRKKLSSCQWACTAIMEVQVQDGQSRQRRRTVMIPLKVVPMWLANVHASKVKAGIRAKLLAYQLECVEVLAAWFLGVSDIPGLADEMQKVKERLLVIEAELRGTRSELSGTQSELRVTQTTLEIVQKRFDSLVGRKPSDEFMTLRAFTDTFGVKGVLGTRIKGGTLGGMSKGVAKLSRSLGAEVRKESHPRFASGVNLFRFDILNAWSILSSIGSVASDKDIEKILQGRLFI